MGYTIEHWADPPLILVTLGEDFDVAQDIADSTKALYDIFNSLTEPMFQVTDATHLKIDFDGLMEFVRVGVRGEHSMVDHPNSRGILVITNNRFYELAIKGMTTAAFGTLKMYAFASREAAFEWVRRQMS